MYHIRVIPTHLKIPHGQLSYISKEFYSVGSIIFVTIKNKLHPAIVVESTNVNDDKAYLKSLPFELLKINKDNTQIKVPQIIVDTIYRFSLYSFTNYSDVIRSIFGSIDFKKILKSGGDTSRKIVIFSNKETKDKNLYKDHECYSFHEFIIEFISFGIPSEITIHNPEDLSDYGLYRMNFDPSIFLFLLCKKLGIKIIINSELPKLRYSEWDYTNIKSQDMKTNDFNILVREDEEFRVKSQALNSYITQIIKNNINQNKKILFINSSKKYASKTVCNDCSEIYKCNNLKKDNTVCNKPMLLVKNERKYAKIYGIAGEYIFICPSCNIGASSYTKCRNCDSFHLSALGFGTERILEEIRKITDGNSKIYDFSERVLKKEYKNWQTDSGIIVSSLSTYKEIENADLVIIPSIGALLYIELFEALEKVRSLIQKSKKCGDELTVIVNTNLEKEIITLEKEIWIQGEMNDRQDLGYPPYGRYIDIALNVTGEKAPSLLHKIANVIKNTNSDINLTVSKDNNLVDKIHVYLPTTKYSLVNDDISLASELKNNLASFTNYLDIKVY